MNKREIKNGQNNKFLITILLLAGIRVFLFNAVFPIFNNVDEPAHLDMVHKYSRGHIPENGIENYDRRTLQFMLLYGSPEYLSDIRTKKNSPMPWDDPNVTQTQDFQNALNANLANINHETGSFPVYYICAGICWNIGKLLHLSDWNLIYLIRFLNVPVFIAMVWVAYLTGKTLFSNNNFLQKGLPIMTAFFPQDMFYSITNDAISPFLFSLSFLMLMLILFENRNLWFYFCTAIVISAALLNKISNITMLALLAPAILFKLHQSITQKQLKEDLPKLLILTGVSIIPLILWMTRNHIVLGDITGSAEKNSFLGWSAKPFGQIWNHPIFTVSGLAFFLGELTKTFWRGEFVWHLERIASKYFDLFYVASTGFFILAAFLALFKNKDKKSRTVLVVSLILVFASVSMLAILSTLYDYGDCWYPSQESPYFTSGRLIVTTLIPFLIIYLYGLEKVLKMFRIKFNPLIVVIALAVAITISEIILSFPAFASPYNWFHIG
ncbi:MAG: DUF2142 domain-containing protein [Sedimentisphaerales bacterium]|nr:DUF2142 domain-containing protein [Sedimentisphaerales bacterium]